MSKPAPTSNPAADLVARLSSGDILSLSRAITALENNLPQAPAILKALQPHLGHSVVVGITGPPGAGKSCLVNAYIGALRQAGQSVGVIAVDPSSPFTGGAILGDRVRMTDHGLDPAVFVRSLASRGHLGGLSPTAARIVDAMDAAGKDIIILETVGAGQSEVEIAEVADIKIVVCAPGLGDDIQAIKAGILEIADILVVNKADLPNAGHTAAQLQGMLTLRRGAAAEVPVLMTVATDGKGIGKLAEAVAALAADSDAESKRARRLARTRRLLASAAAEWVQQEALQHDDPRFADLCEAVQTGEVDLATAAQELLKAMVKKR